MKKGVYITMVRTPLKQGEIIQLNNRQYTIEKDIGTGATCIVYSAYYNDTRNQLHYVNIKECYPYKAEVARKQQELIWKDIDEKDKAFAEFNNAYDRLISIQNLTGLRNSTVRVWDISAANGTLYYVMDLNDGTTFDHDDASILDTLKTVCALANTVKKYHDKVKVWNLSFS